MSLKKGFQGYINIEDIFRWCSSFTSFVIKICFFYNQGRNVLIHLFIVILFAESMSMNYCDPKWHCFQVMHLEDDICTVIAYTVTLQTLTTSKPALHPSAPAAQPQLLLCFYRGNCKGHPIQSDQWTALRNTISLNHNFKPYIVWFFLLDQNIKQIFYTREQQKCL